MNVECWLGRWASAGRITLVIVLPATVTLLSACWEWDVAGPLIGVGAAGTGATIVAVEGAPSSRPSVSVESQRGDNSNPVVAHSANPQPLDAASGPVTAALPAFAPSTTPPRTVAAARHSRNSRLRQQRKSKTQDVARSGNARRPHRRVGPLVTGSKSSTTLATRSPNIAAAKGPPRPRLSHPRGSITRVIASTAKPQPSDHRSGPVTAALPDTAPPGELPATTIVQ